MHQNTPIIEIAISLSLAIIIKSRLRSKRKSSSYRHERWRSCCAIIYQSHIRWLWCWLESK